MRARTSIANRMGDAALDDLVMVERCGEPDPGVVLHLIRDRGMSVEGGQELLARESGLLVFSGLSDDMRDFLASIGRRRPPSTCRPPASPGGARCANIDRSPRSGPRITGVLRLIGCGERRRGAHNRLRRRRGVGCQELLG
ncbi:hypothetical protein [Paralimibaculum aggregatum]|uniref:hypothetical protein n=1 Tax=Paralimibaculum aggregatum TaxID=3036245 RepID=UPI0025522DE0|nr:hypothetical protein [Limibaculum sp. NKW23]